jgi:hypothetical protein
MAFTAQELENISNAALDFHLRGAVHKQSIQDKPLYRALRAKQKTFPGGKEKITKRAKGDYTVGIQGYTHDDVVTYVNPANIKQAEYSWYEIHAGIQFTMTELKKDGVSVVDSLNGANTSQHSQREKTALAGILEDKMEDMSEGYSRGMNEMYWRDGTADTKQAPGVQSVILGAPSSATIVGGIDQQANTWWRNRASLALVASTPSNMIVVKKLEVEMRQLRRYGGRPSVAFAGADFLDHLNAEILSKGNYTQTGFNSNGATDIGMADVKFKNIPFIYDPTLDDESLAKYCYIMDLRHMRPYVMEGEDDKTHSPARPDDQYIVNRAMTWTGGFVCWQRNAQGVYSIA